MTMHKLLFFFSFLFAQKVGGGGASHIKIVFCKREGTTLVALHDYQNNISKIYIEKLTPLMESQVH